MILHSDLGINKFNRNKNLGRLINKKEVTLAGNNKLKIYGLLSCNQGKRMKMENRVFFKSVEEAEVNNFRPCGNCMKKRYLLWKTGEDKLRHK